MALLPEPHLVPQPLHLLLQELKRGLFFGGTLQGPADLMLLEEQKTKPRQEQH